MIYADIIGLLGGALTTVHFSVNLRAMATLTLPTTEARTRFLSMVKDVDKAFTRYVITHRGKPHAVMMAVDEFEGWLETLDIMSNPEEVTAIQKFSLDEKRITHKQMLKKYGLKKNED